MFEIRFSGNDFDEVKVKIQEFAFNFLGMQLKMKLERGPRKSPGRPKMTRDQHLKHADTVYEKTQDPIFQEMEALLTQVYERLGPSIALQILNKCGAHKLSDLEEAMYNRFSQFCKDYLSNS